MKSDVGMVKFALFWDMVFFKNLTQFLCYSVIYILLPLFSMVIVSEVLLIFVSCRVFENEGYKRIKLFMCDFTRTVHDLNFHHIEDIWIFNGCNQNR